MAGCHVSDLVRAPQDFPGVVTSEATLPSPSALKLILSRYSAEVAGTIIVQCVPVLRPFVKDLHTTMTSRKLAATEPSKGAGSTWRGSTLIDKKQTISIMSRDEEMGHKHAGMFELAEIPEEGYRGRTGDGKKLGYSAEAYYSPSEVELRIQEAHTRPLSNRPAQRRENWPL